MGMQQKKDYCTQNDGDCETCSLSNYGRDCMNQSIKTDEPDAPDAENEEIGGPVV